MVPGILNTIQKKELIMTQTVANPVEETQQEQKTIDSIMEQKITCDACGGGGLAKNMKPRTIKVKNFTSVHLTHVNSMSS